MNKMKQLISHREYTLDEAWLIGLNEAEENNINLRFNQLGKITETDLQLETFLCAANNHQTKLSSLGGGSGYDQHGKIKALYEALEYSLSFQICANNQIERLHHFSSATSPSTQFLLHKKIMPNVLLEEPYLSHSYPWIELSHYQQPEKTLHYPLGLIYPFISQLEHLNPSLHKDQLGELSNDTGLAIGASPEEAMIHGINQWVERDAYSLFLLKTIVNKNPVPARLIIKETLPEDLLVIVQALEKHYQEEIFIVDISSNTRIPAFVVSFSRQNMLLQPQGSGASLAKEVALKQALFESMQYKDRFNQNAQKYRQENELHLAKTPLLLQAMKANIPDLKKQKQYIEVDWQTIASYPLVNNLKEQIELMVDLLAKQGVNIFYTNLYQSISGVSLSYILIPELESFGHIRDAKFFPLKQRGLEVFQ